MLLDFFASLVCVQFLTQHPFMSEIASPQINSPCMHFRAKRTTISVEIAPVSGLKFQWNARIYLKYIQMNDFFRMHPMLYASRLSTTPTQSLIHHAIFSQTGPPPRKDCLFISQFRNRTESRQRCGCKHSLLSTKLHWDISV